jgi:hypothetical protein
MLAKQGPGQRPRRRRAAGGSILGLTVARHFLKLDALSTEISDEQIETVLRPWLTAALGDDSPADA